MSQSQLLPADTHMGAVTLWVADLDTMIRYYREGVGLQLLSHVGNRAVLGFKDIEILILEHKPMMKHASPHEAGLLDRKSTRLNSSHVSESRMPSSA